MKHIDLTLKTPEENLALDEALLDLCEENLSGEILRFWEPRDYFVVVGYSNKVHEEVNVPACREKQVPILRRCSGGGTVLQGPGCLNYSLILQIPDSGPLTSITKTNDYLMGRHKEALEELLAQKINVQGSSDLTLNNLKFSGNAQRRKKNFLLFHGTFLLQFNIRLIEELLPMPSKEPVYREKRTHKDFLVNLASDAAVIKNSLKKFWEADEALTEIPADKIEALVLEKYSKNEWNFKR